MKQGDLLEAVNERVPFRTARRLLVASGYPTGWGWDAIVEKLKDPKVAALANQSRLLSLYIEALAASEKRLSAYCANQTDIQSLNRKLAAKLALDKGAELAKSYPLPISRLKLEALSSKDVVVAGKVAAPTADIYILSYVKESRTRIALNPNVVVGASASDFSEVYGIRIEKAQVFDAVVLPNKGDRFFILTDIKENTSQEWSRASLSRVIDLLKNITKVDFKNFRANLFPAVSAFYRDPNVEILHLEHTSADGQAITEKIKGRQKCVRSAEYHQGGMNAVNGATDPFGVSVSWKMPSIGDIEANPELHLFGNGGLAYGLNPLIESADISKAATVAELMTALSSLAGKI